MIESPPDALRQLIAAERAAPVTNAAAQAAVRAKVGATLGIGKVAAAGAVTKAALTLKVLTVVIAVGAVTTAVVATRDHAQASATATAPARAAAPRPSLVPAGVTATPIEVTPIAEEPPRDKAPPSSDAPAADLTVLGVPRHPTRRARTEHVAPRSSATAQPVSPPPAPRSQADLLADASRALSGDDATHALALIDEDARAHPDGPLGEEREALRISTLSALGRRAEAADAAARLLAKYPRTIHRLLAEGALTKDRP
jgi:hypothetical protein